MTEIHYYNLTNGIEDLNQDHEARFVRIQSTLLEQKHFGQVIRELDNDLLMHLALGYKCVIHDKGSRNGKISRACWYGIPWIKYCLERAWLDIVPKIAPVKTYNLAQYFGQQYKKLDQSEKRKLLYFKKFAITDEINLEYICDHTTHDGDYRYYSNILKKFVLNNQNIGFPTMPLFRWESVIFK